VSAAHYFAIRLSLFATAPSDLSILVDSAGTSWLPASAAAAVEASAAAEAQQHALAAAWRRAADGPGAAGLK